MDNKAMAAQFNLLGKLMDLHDENPFRIRNIVNAAFRIGKLDFQLATKSHEEWLEIPGLGKSAAARISEIFETGMIADLQSYLEKTPAGIVEMLSLKGIGPKKIKVLWQDLGLTTMGEVLYACNENRLIEAKGFGLKTQDQIKKIILFAQANKGWFLFAHVEEIAEKVMEKLKKYVPLDELISFTGEYRRKCEIIQEITILHTSERAQVAMFASKEKWSPVEDLEDTFIDQNNLKFRFIKSNQARFGHDLIQTTGSETHLDQLVGYFPGGLPLIGTEEEIYAEAGLAFIPPVLREGNGELSRPTENSLPTRIQFQDLKGALHNHSTYSDGVHTLREMALYAKNEMGLSYFGIADHSKSAVYARGLPEEQVYAQWEEIEQLNQELAPFQIIKGIESDILSDGSLDYPDELLAGFDYVVASIHSVLHMDRDRATERLIKAIENPYTSILGHPTGRLLLARSGYEIDHVKVIDACAANHVAIEINANPLRLDLDWRWHRYAIEKEVFLCINPDAHRTTGLWDMRYGIYVAQKGGVQIENCLNAWPIEKLMKFFTKNQNIPL